VPDAKSSDHEGHEVPRRKYNHSEVPSCTFVSFVVKELLRAKLMRRRRRRIISWVPHFSLALREVGIQPRSIPELCSKLFRAVTDIRYPQFLKLKCAERSCRSHFCSCGDGRLRPSGWAKPSSALQCPRQRPSFNHPPNCPRRWIFCASLRLHPDPRSRTARW
jgi:hypothetical protein